MEKENIYANKYEKAAQLIQIAGHPLETLHLENLAFEKVLAKAKSALEEGAVSAEILAELRGIVIHYDKKGDLLYPHLKAKYQIAGPSDLMWTDDDAIRDELSDLEKLSCHDANWMERLRAVLKEAEMMLIKDEKVLFPNCAVNFTREEWYGIYRDLKDYPECYGIPNGYWEEAEEAILPNEQVYDDAEIVMPGGHLNLQQLTALLNTIPMEVTFVDAENINRFFNEGPKVFKRPGMAIDREVFSCHPPKVEAQVRQIIDEFRAGTLDYVPFWMDKMGKSMYVQYMAVRDQAGHYLGTVELVQDMAFAKEHFEQKIKAGED